MLKLINKIYICHYTKLLNRKPILDSQINKLNLNNITEWVEVYDKEEIDINKLINELPNIKNKLNIKGHFNRTLKMSEISLLLKHNHIWENMIENDIENVLVLEDDALFNDNFITDFNSYIDELPSDYDLLWVGSCCGLHANPLENGKHIYRKDGSRCTHAYLINKKCAIKMLEYFKINNSPADFMFNEAIIKYKLNNYWLEPDIISQNGIFKTSIQR